MWLSLICMSIFISLYLVYGRTEGGLCSERDILKTSATTVKLKGECTELRFIKRNPGVETLKRLFVHIESLKLRSQLESLDFRTFGVTTEELALIVDFVATTRNARIKILHLAGAVIDDANFAALCKLVGSNQYLQELGLEATHMDATRAHMLARSIQASNKQGKLQMVRLDMNSIGADGAQALFKAHKVRWGKPHDTTCRIIHPLVHKLMHQDALERDQLKNERLVAKAKANTKSSQETPVTGGTKAKANAEAKAGGTSKDRSRAQASQMVPVAESAPSTSSPEPVRRAVPHTERPSLYSDIIGLLRYCAIDNPESLGVSLRSLGADDAFHLAEIDPALLDALDRQPTEVRLLRRCICTNYLHKVHAQRLRSTRKAAELAQRYVAPMCREQFVRLHGHFQELSRSERGRQKERQKYHDSIAARVQSEKEMDVVEVPEGEGGGGEEL